MARVEVNLVVKDTIGETTNPICMVFEKTGVDNGIHRPLSDQHNLPQCKPTMLTDKQRRVIGGKHTTVENTATQTKDQPTFVHIAYNFVFLWVCGITSIAVASAAFGITYIPFSRVTGVNGKVARLSIFRQQFGNSWWAAIPLLCLGFSSLFLGSVCKVLITYIKGDDGKLKEFDHQWTGLTWFAIMSAMSYLSFGISFAALSIDTMGAVALGQNLKACVSHNNTISAGDEAFFTKASSCYEKEHISITNASITTPTTLDLSSTRDCYCSGLDDTCAMISISNSYSDECGFSAVNYVAHTYPRDVVISAIFSGSIFVLVVAFLFGSVYVLVRYDPKRPDLSEPWFETTHPIPNVCLSLSV